ncbi:LlaJI family restriction endonuclease [Corynebacterium sanguinis]|uniref:LlaJI family restriction endonuclease n=1 Tax=Corynebacterium sanguinis TaxID=2594913 RepID=UPI00223A77D5|nr:LlaJI family restriction endonuclease [Corynebacterium sanguinis]MCT1665080.1 LlaJI family restriction endonuclease [Corynebacterium sanguinis]
MTTSKPLTIDDGGPKYNTFQPKVATDSNEFVGLRVRNGRVTFTFPRGIDIPEQDNQVRELARKVIKVMLQSTRKLDDPEFGPDGADVLEETGAFPVSSCLRLAIDYSETLQLLTERETTFRVNGKGVVDWKRTFASFAPLSDASGNLIYSDHITRRAIPATRSYLTCIHQYCLDYSFATVGWLIADGVPTFDGIPINVVEAIQYLRKKLSQTHDSRRLSLIDSMIKVLGCRGGNPKLLSFSLGTSKFENIWESMVEKVFGDGNKQDFFPTATYRLENESARPAPLQPDTVFEEDGVLCILDAKYYKFGDTLKINDLPGTADINKQVTYGLFAAEQTKKPVFNAFVLPFSSSRLCENRIVAKGIALPDWVSHPQPSQTKIAIILVDTSTLIDWTLSSNSSCRAVMIDTILDAHRAYDHN